jgi:hypothetical protein
LIVPDPPYSPDLAPSDSFRFANMKDKLKGFSFPSAVHLHHPINETVHSIVMATFDEWIARGERNIKSERETTWKDRHKRSATTISLIRSAAMRRGTWDRLYAEGRQTMRRQIVTSRSRSVRYAAIWI